MQVYGQGKLKFSLRVFQIHSSHYSISEAEFQRGALHLLNALGRSESYETSTGLSL